jgi:hypothetical protein
MKKFIGWLFLMFIDCAPLIPHFHQNVQSQLYLISFMLAMDMICD